jgi:hypothetical protein
VSRVLGMKSVSGDGRLWVLISLESGMASPNLNETDGCSQNSGTVPDLEYCSAKYSCDPRFN